MVQGSICKFNKFGFCKFGNKCFRKHENKECEIINCDIESCSLRHPKKCRFYFEFKYCKFGTFCRYKHEKSSNEVSSEIENLKHTIECLKKEIAKKDKEINIKDIEIIKLKDKNRDLEKENEDLKQTVQELKVDLEAKNNTMAENDMLHLDIMERVRDKYGYCSDDEESEYESDEEKRASNRYIFRLKKAEELRKDLKCDVCQFTTKSEAGLKSHKTKKHIKN